VFWRSALNVAVCSMVIAACGAPADRPELAAADAPAQEEAVEIEAQPEAGDCAATRVPAQPLPVDLFAVVDGSGSMMQAASNGVSKWYATKAALRDFLEGADPEMGFGLLPFPLSGRNSGSCSIDDYREAALPIAALSAQKQGALAELDALEPHGRTPLGPVLSAALALAVEHGVREPKRSAVLLLASDGLATACEPSDAAALARMAGEALAGPGHVRTLVITSQTLEQSAVEPGFELIAKAGGTGRVLRIDPRLDFAQQLGAALRGAAAHEVACDLAVPAPPPGERLDHDSINVAFDTEQGSVTLPRVAGAGACGGDGGWYYDVDPARGQPERINMCRSACARLAELGAGELRVELGCRTLVK
jgi:hypothetical protein